jgi:hypothetical protein
MTGLITDLIGRGVFLYTSLAGLHVLNILIVVIIMIISAVTDSRKVFTNHSEVYSLLIGWVVSENFVLMFYVLPLYICSKIREKRAYWEIPMAA